MALEERQKQIREGAGLEESRLNTEFIEWLKKYSTPVLLIIAVVAGGYALWTRYQRDQAIKMDTAAVELEAALEAANPVTLAAVAADHSSRGGLPLLAKLAAADLHMDAFRTGVPAGVTLTPSGDFPEGSKLLTDEERQGQLAKASEFYQSIIDGANSTTGQQLAAVNAAIGLSAVAESKGDFDKARQMYTAAAEKAKKIGFTDLATLAEKRVESLDSIKNAPKLPATSELHASLRPAPQPTTTTTPMSNIQFKDAAGNPINLNATPTPAPAITPAVVPTQPATTEPAPAPAPKP
jgi:tetratricopeptide (TPR) repeat protein